jgi:hypothetical protein
VASVITGGKQVVKVAAVVVAVLQLFVNTARYWLPLTETLTVTFSDVLVAPEMSLKDAPPLVLTCHCTVGAGLPLAAAVKVTVPLLAVCDTGFVVTIGAELTLSVALCVAVPHAPPVVTTTV